MADIDYSALENIRVKVRRLTRTPSTAQMTNATLDEYINTFVLYDFPEHLRTFSLRTTLEFFLTPFIDTYSGDDIETNFINKYTNVYDNAYVAGYKQLYSQDRQQFFNMWPKLSSEKQVATGDAVTTNFTGTLDGIPILRNNVFFTSIGANSTRLAIYDVPNVPNDGTGVFAGDIGVAGTINYTSGAYNITFVGAPANGEEINSQTVPYSAGRPTSMLYYNNELTFRPIPDKPYRVELEVATRPVELLAGNMPELAQWSQYIAYGSAKKIFEDRMDMESVQMIMPEFKQQELLVNRRTIDQQSSQRVSTIYTDSIVGTQNHNN